VKLKFLITASFHDYQYLYHGFHRKPACCRYFIPFTNGSPVKNKHHLHSRHLAFYLVYGTETVNKYMSSGKIGISETNQLKHGASGQDCFIFSGVAEYRSSISYG
jgi:hypothetical protein